MKRGDYTFKASKSSFGVDYSTKPEQWNKDGKELDMDLKVKYLTK